MAPAETAIRDASRRPRGPVAVPPEAGSSSPRPPAGLNLQTAAIVDALARRTDRHFWWTTLARGFLALFTASVILVVPGMARFLLLLPIAMVIAVLGLAVYGVFDSALIFISSFMASTPRIRLALRLQGAAGMIAGTLLYLVFFDQVQMKWFLLLIALQAFTTAIAEFTVARHANQRASSHWDYAAAAIALLFGGTYLSVAIVLGDALDPGQMAWLVYAYLLCFGLAHCLKAARRLYADFHQHIVQEQPIPLQEI